MHEYIVSGLGIGFAFALLEHTGGQSGVGLGCVFGNCGNVLGNGRGFWGFFDVQELDIENQHSGRGARRRILTVGEFGRDPEAAFLALNHQLNAFSPTFDHAVERETGGLTTLHG